MSCQNWYIMPMWNTLKQKMNWNERAHDLKLWNIENNQHVAFPAGLCWIVDIVPKTDHARRLETRTGGCWHISYTSCQMLFFFSRKDQGENYKHNIIWKPLPFRSTTKFRGVFLKTKPLRPPTNPGCESHLLPKSPFLFRRFCGCKPQKLLRSLKKHSKRWGWKCGKLIRLVVGNKLHAIQLLLLQGLKLRWENWTVVFFL